MAKLSELPQATSLNGGELIPIAVIGDTSSSNYVVTVQMLASNVSTLENLTSEEVVLSLIQDALIEYATTNDMNTALLNKSDIGHNHDAVYSDKLHTHSYVDLTGLPEIPNVSQQDIEGLNNRLEEAKATITTMQMDIESLNNTITSLVETIGLLEGRITALENSAQTPAQNS